MAVEEPSVPEAILVRPAPAPAAPTKSQKAEEPKKVAEPKKPVAATSEAKVPHDAELAAIAAKAAAPLKPEKRPAADEKRTPLAAVTAPEPARPEPTEGYFDEDGDFVELPLEKSVKAFVATLAPVVPPPTTRARAGGNGESLDAALDQFVRDAKAWSSALPKPTMDDKRLAALAKVPEPEPPPAPKPAPKPAEPVLPPAARLEPLPAQPRSVLFPSILSFVLGGAVIFGVVWFLGFGPKRDGGETGTQEPGTAATKPDDKKAVTPVAGPIGDSAPAVVAKPLEAGAAASMAAKPADAAPAAAATPDAAAATAAPDAGAVTPAPKVAKVKKVRKVRKAVKKAAVVKKVEKPEPKAKKGKKGKKDSDWVDPFSQ
jgi:hypothetical protein